MPCAARCRASPLSDPAWESRTVKIRPAVRRDAAKRCPACSSKASCSPAPERNRAFTAPMTPSTPSRPPDGAAPRGLPAGGPSPRDLPLRAPTPAPGRAAASSPNRSRAASRSAPTHSTRHIALIMASMAMIITSSSMEPRIRNHALSPSHPRASIATPTPATLPRSGVVRLHSNAPAPAPRAILARRSPDTRSA